ncbi:MAG: TadE/TadG family type IV pilus assembly protein [Vicinamibacterales bacterium]
MKRLTHLRRDERGMSFVFIGMGFVSFLAATTLAIDVGMLMTARNQAQNAADAGALGGAVALVYNSYTDRSASGPAVRSAVSSAQANQVMREPVSVGPADVMFLTDDGGQPNRVQVQVFRNAERGNPLSMLIGQMFGVQTANITATATAEVAPSNAASCILPFTIPDKWVERQTPAWDPSDTFNAFPSNPSVQPDLYRGADHSSATGYRIANDVGLQLTLKAGTGTNIAPSMYFALALPGNSGANDYEWAIANCNTAVVHWGDPLVQEPGNMVGPTAQGVRDLIALDPAARWDPVQQKVVDSAYGRSPRIKLVPLFDPLYWNQGKMNGRPADLKAANFLGFFVEGLQGHDVMGRVVPATAQLDTSAPVPVNSFARSIRLVE